MSSFFFTEQASTGFACVPEKSVSQHSCSTEQKHEDASTVDRRAGLRVDAILWRRISRCRRPRRLSLALRPGGRFPEERRELPGGGCGEGEGGAQDRNARARNGDAFEKSKNASEKHSEAFERNKDAPKKNKDACEKNKDACERNEDASEKHSEAFERNRIAFESDRNARAKHSEAFPKNGNGLGQNRGARVRARINLEKQVAPLGRSVPPTTVSRDWMYRWPRRLMRTLVEQKRRASRRR